MSVLTKRKITRSYSERNTMDINGPINIKKRRLSDDISNKYDDMFIKLRNNNDNILKTKFDPDLYIDKDISQTLICGICLYVCDSPGNIGCISNHFACQSCLVGLIKNRDRNRSLTCPICRQPINRKLLGKLNRLVSNIVNISKMKCIHHNICPWIGKHNEFSLHIEICQYNEYACKNCGKHVMKNDFNAHINKYKCVVQCNYCEEIYPRIQINEHEMHCDLKSIKCGNYKYGCKASNLNKTNMSHHMNYICEYREIKCEYGCGKLIRLNFLKQHNIDYMEQHMEYMQNIKHKYDKMKELHDIIQYKAKEFFLWDAIITNKCIEYCNNLSENDLGSSGTETSNKSDDDDDDDDNDDDNDNDTDGIPNSDTSDDNTSESDDDNDNDNENDDDMESDNNNYINDDE